MGVEDAVVELADGGGTCGVVAGWLPDLLQPARAAVNARKTGIVFGHQPGSRPELLNGFIARVNLPER